MSQAFYFIEAAYFIEDLWEGCLSHTCHWSLQSLTRAAVYLLKLWIYFSTNWLTFWLWMWKISVRGNILWKWYIFSWTFCNVVNEIHYNESFPFHFPGFFFYSPLSFIWSVDIDLKTNIVNRFKMSPFLNHESSRKVSLWLHSIPQYFIACFDIVCKLLLQSVVLTFSERKPT